MTIIDTRVESAGPHRLVVITTIELEVPSESEQPELGEGPTGDAIPDRIVRALIEKQPESMTLTEIQHVVGGNPATVNRQAWTLANDAPDLQRRLRGWVTNVARGRYVLSTAARRHVDE